MASPRGGTHDAEVARVLIFWTRPHHLSDQEIDAWTWAEARRLLGIAGVERLELTRLESASERHARPWDWMVELHLTADADRRGCIDAGPGADWIRDLRLLGLRPAVLLAEDTTAVTEGDR
jgi:hypothetical protein